MQNKFKNYFILLISGATFFACTEKKDIPAIAPVDPPVDKNWVFETTPVWEDNFTTATVDLSKWTFELGGSGWGNNELQYYTGGANSTVSGGNLSITAKKENFSGREYTSSRMISRGKGDWLYGRFEIRAKLQYGCCLQIRHMVPGLHPEKLILWNMWDMTPIKYIAAYTPLRIIIPEIHRKQLTLSFPMLLMFFTFIV